ncbi:MAG: hypothetical protein ACRD3W_32230 [Terriglobales bacterium]
MREQVTDSAKINASKEIAAEKPTSKAKETLAIISTVLPIAGALGTGFVWMAANYYVGEIEIKTDRPYQSLTVDAFNKKGQGSSFHGNKLQLMPGAYHLEVAADGKAKHSVDVDVDFGKTKQVLISLAEPEAQGAPAKALAQSPSSATDTAADDGSDKAHRHWWQFWRKTIN